MIDRKIVEQLKLFNLTEYESKTYAALVINGPSTVKEIRELAEIPYSREYDILTNLEQRGFVELQPGRPRKYIAVDPNSVLKKELEERKKAVEALLNSLAPLYELSKKKESPEDVFWIIRGVENIREKLAEMIGSAEKEILIVGARPASTSAVKKALQKAARRRVKMRALGMFDKEQEEMFAAIGAKARYYKHDHSRFVLIDDKELILASEDPENCFFAMYNKNPGCIKLYQNYFELAWRKARKSI